MWPISYIKLAAVVLILAAAGVAAYKVHGWHQDSLRVAAVEARAAQDVAQARQAAESYKTQYAASQAASKGYQDDLSKIRAERDRLRSVPARPVRLCQSAPAVPGPGPGAGRPDAATAPADQGAGAAGRDIGPELYGLADDTDQREAELAAQIRKLQSLLSQGATP